MQCEGPHTLLCEPARALKPLGLERYGDYYFTDYPETPGVTHGEPMPTGGAASHFRLLGSLDESSGYTMIRYDANAGKLTLSRDCCGVRCNGGFHVFDLFYAEGAEKEVYDGWFAAMGLPKKPAERIAGYSSWYNRYQDIDEKCILSDLSGCARGSLRGRCIPDRRRLGARRGRLADDGREEIPEGIARHGG